MMLCCCLPGAWHKVGTCNFVQDTRGTLGNFLVQFMFFLLFLAWNRCVYRSVKRTRIVFF